MLVLSGHRFNIPGILSYLDTPNIPEEIERNRRRKRISKIVVHSSGVAPPTGNVVPGAGSQSQAQSLARYATRREHSSWHFSVGYDGAVAQSLDPGVWVGWHADNDQLNDESIGIEMRQLSAERGGGFYQATIESTVHLIALLCCFYGIQVQIPWKNGRPFLDKIPRIETSTSSLVGIFAHRNVPNSNHGDPGPAIFQALHAIGAEGFDFNANEDLYAWVPRQNALGVLPDGIAGRATTEALKARGYQCGLWIAPPTQGNAVVTQTGNRGGSGGAGILWGAAALAGLYWLIRQK